VSRWTASRLAWSLWLLAMVLVALSVLLGVRNAATFAAFVDDILVFVPMVVSFATVGALIAARHPGNPIGWLFASFAAIVGLGLLASEYASYALVTAPGSLPGGDWAAWLGAWSLEFAVGIPAFIFLLFPDGHLLSPRWRPLTWLIVATSTLDVALAALSNLAVADFSPFATSPVQVLRGGTVQAVYIANQAAEAAILLASALCLVVRLRRARGEQRQQLKWVAYTATVGFAAFGIVTVVGWPKPVVVAAVAFPAVAIAAAIAILRYRLYDIDLLITRTLVYGLLTALVTVVYLAVVVGIGTLIGSRGKPNLFLSIVATALIAVAFQPARERSRRLANRLVYGKRATPYEILSGFSRGMTGTSTDDSLQWMARLVVEATGAVQVTVWLRLGEVLQPQAAWPQAGPLPEPIPLQGRSVQEALAMGQAKSRAFPVGHQGELLGALTITVSPAEQLTLAGEKLIGDLAAQTGLGIHLERMKERALFARALASFLPPEVAELVETSPATLSLREELEATIVFSDIRGFSTLAERLPPRQVAEVVGRHLTAMVEVVTSHGGVLDKFAGDAVMAVFGAPRPTKDHAQRALGCAVAMQHRQAALNHQAAAAGLPAFQIGIGINTGTVIAGTLGGPGRLDYTVLGDAVNIAQRLQSQAVGGEILASAVTVRQAGTDQAEPVGRKHLKGRQELVEVYRIRWADTPTAQQPLLKGSGPAEA
jgi:class 3 adenylate cyclase